jgi:flagellar biosynthesis protein FliR
MTLSHFSAVLLFSLFVSIVFGITQRAEPKMMVRFGAFCFVLFVGGTVVASWALWLIKQ